MTGYVDSHCHLDRYDDIEDVLKRARDVGVGCVLSISVHRENADKVVKLAERFPEVYAAVGVHPCDVHEDSLTDLEAWLVAKSEHPKVIGLGETGLDIQPKSPMLERQLQAFNAHIRASLMTGLPLVVHIRNAFNAFFDVWQGWQREIPLGVLHCFTGTWEEAEMALDLGWYLSFSGIVTFKRNGELSEVARKVPEDRFLLETDAPWLAPEPYRGRPNEPSYIVHTAEKIAYLRGKSLIEIQTQSQENFFRLFSKAKVQA